MTSWSWLLDIPLAMANINFCFSVTVLMLHTRYVGVIGVACGRWIKLHLSLCVATSRNEYIQSRWGALSTRCVVVCGFGRLLMVMGRCSTHDASLLEICRWYIMSMVTKASKGYSLGKKRWVCGTDGRVFYSQRAFASRWSVVSPHGECEIREVLLMMVPISTRWYDGHVIHILLLLGYRLLPLRGHDED